MKPRTQLPPDATPADLARAIAHLRAQGKHAAADYLASHLPPAHPPLPHLGSDGQQFFSPNVASPDGNADDGTPAIKGTLSPHGVPHPTNAQSAGSLPPRIDKAYETFGVAKPEPHSYGCVYLPLPEPQRSRVLTLGKMIADIELTDRGRDPEPHVTALHGILSDDVAPVFAVLSHFRPVRMKLGKVSIFAGTEYDVVKIEVESDSLNRLNEALRELPHYAKFRDFRAHVTIGLVKPGTGPLFALRFNDLNEICTCDTAIFETPDGTKNVYPLGRTITVNKAMSYLDSGSGGALVAPAQQGRRVKLKRKRRMLSRITKALEGIGAVNSHFSPLTEPVFAAPALLPDSPDFDAELYVFGTKAFDESHTNREKSAHDGKRPGEFAPKGSTTAKQGNLFDDDDDATSAPAPTATKPARPAKEPKPVELTDDQCDALRALAEHFPDGIAHLLTKTGHLDRDKAFPEEAATKKRIAKLRAKWEAADAKIKSAASAAKKSESLAAHGATLNDEINERVGNAEQEVDAGLGYLDRDTDDETYDAIDDLNSALADLNAGEIPEFDDPPDPDEYSEDDFPDEDDDPDTLDDQESNGEQAVKDVGARLSDFQSAFADYDKSVAESSEKWRQGTRELLEAVHDTAKNALAIPIAKYHTASRKAADQDEDDYDPSDIDALLAKVKEVHAAATALLPKLS